MVESIERMAKTKSENRELKERIIQLQDLLEYQKLIGVTRYNAVDAKYNSMKQIVVGLEVCPSDFLVWLPSLNPCLNYSTTCWI